MEAPTIQELSDSGTNDSRTTPDRFRHQNDPVQAPKKADSCTKRSLAFGLRVQGFGSRVSGLGFRVQGLGLRVGLDLRV